MISQLHGVFIFQIFENPYQLKSGVGQRARSARSILAPGSSLNNKIRYWTSRHYPITNQWQLHTVIITIIKDMHYKLELFHFFKRILEFLPNVPMFHRNFIHTIFPMSVFGFSGSPESKQFFRFFCFAIILGRTKHFRIKILYLKASNSSEWGADGSIRKKQQQTIITINAIKVTIIGPIQADKSTVVLSIVSDT